MSGSNPPFVTWEPFPWLKFNNDGSNIGQRRDKRSLSTVNLPICQSAQIKAAAAEPEPKQPKKKAKQNKASLDLCKMTVPQLQKELERRKLDTKGKKAALLARLTEAV